MDFHNIFAEYEYLSNSSRNSLETISNLNTYYKTMYKYGELFYSNTRKAIETFFLEQIKIDTKSSLSKNLFEFYRSYEDYMIKLKVILNKFNKDIIDPIGIFHVNLTTIFSEGLEEMKLISNNVVDAKKNLEKIKMKYYESCRLVQEQEKNVCKNFSGKISNKDEELNYAHDNLLKFKSQSENFAQHYKYELSKFNKILEENEKKYTLAFSKLKTNEESRIFFIKCSMEKFSKVYEEFAMSSFDFLNRLNSTLVEIKIDEDIKLFNEKYRLKENTTSRLPKEEFIPYEVYKKNFAETNSESNQANSTDNSPMKSFSSQHSSDRMDLMLLNSISEDFEVVNESQFYSEQYQQNLIEEFLRHLFSENEVEAESMAKFMEVLYNNQNFAKSFIDSILRDRKNLYINLTHFNNLQHFANILNTISLHLDDIYNENYDLNFAIIFIAERTFCQIRKDDTVKKIYLSAILSKNKLYATRSFWIDLIELKLSRKIEDHISRMDRNFLLDNIPTMNREKADSNMFANLGAKIKNIFNVKESFGKEVTSSSSARGSGINIFKNLENVAYNKKIIIEKITVTELCSIIKEYIPHLANFNFDVSEAIDMIVELSTKYKITKEKISYFVTYLNSCVFTIKNKLPNCREDVERRRSKNSSFLNKTNDYKITIIASTLKFLSPIDFVNMTLMNKNTNQKMSKKIYKFLLKKTVNLNERLTLWNCVLKTNELRKKFDYKQILEDINEKRKNNEKNVSSFSDMIDLDVQRTFFEENVEESRRAIGNMLKGIAYTNPKINYCQGMNYIASFLYKMTPTEEEAFYLMLGLFENTDFSLIFIEDLLRLKIFFYVFERLLSLYLPELYTYFKTNSVNVNYFCSPWFITLFTNTTNYISQIDPPQILLRIWDDFLINGWKALMRTSLYLLKTYESYLVTLRYEDLLHFLINEMTKSGFFQNSNLSLYNLLLNTTRIKNELINNLENEYIQGNKIKELDEKTRNVNMTFNNLNY